MLLQDGKVCGSIFKASTWVSQWARASTRDLWQKATSKYEGRCKDFTRGGLSPSAGLRYHETFAVPGLSYLSHVAPDDGDLKAMQALATQRLLQMPWRALPQGAAPLLHQAGLPRIRDLSMVCAAARMRAAHRHADEVRVCAERLETARAVTRPLAAMVGASAGRDDVWWRSAALADSMGPDLARACVSVFASVPRTPPSPGRARPTSTDLARNHDLVDLLMQQIRRHRSPIRVVGIRAALLSVRRFRGECDSHMVRRVGMLTPPRARAMRMPGVRPRRRRPAAAPSAVSLALDRRVPTDRAPGPQVRARRSCGAPLSGLPRTQPWAPRAPRQLCHGPCSRMRRVPPPRSRSDAMES